MKNVCVNNTRFKKCTGLVLDLLSANRIPGLYFITKQLKSFCQLVYSALLGKRPHPPGDKATRYVTIPIFNHNLHWGHLIHLPRRIHCFSYHRQAQIYTHIFVAVRNCAILAAVLSLRLAAWRQQLSAQIMQPITPLSQRSYDVNWIYIHLLHKKKHALRCGCWYW